MPGPKFRRRKWLIDDEVQVGVAVRLTLILVGYLFLFSLIALSGPLVVVFSADTSGLEYAAAKTEIGAFAGGILPPLLFALACMVMHGVLLLHRLAGPVYRIRRGLEDIGDRNLAANMHLRDRDFLQPMAALYNGSIRTLRDDFAAARAETAAIREVAGDVSEGARERLFRHLGKLEDVLARYRLTRDAPTIDLDEEGLEVKDAEEKDAVAAPAAEVTS